jgi:hypothetical protein
MAIVRLVIEKQVKDKAEANIFAYNVLNAANLKDKVNNSFDETGTRIFVTFDCSGQIKKEEIFGS